MAVVKTEVFMLVLCFLMLIAKSNVGNAQCIYFSLLPKVHLLYTSDSVLNTVLDRVVLGIEGELWELRWHFQKNNFPESLLRAVLLDWFYTLFTNLMPIVGVARLILGIVELDDAATIVKLIGQQSLKLLDERAEVIIDIVIPDELFRFMKGWKATWPTIGNWARRMPLTRRWLRRPT